LIAGVEVMAKSFVLVSKSANGLLGASDIRILGKIRIPLDVRLCELTMSWHRASGARLHGPIVENGGEVAGRKFEVESCVEALTTASVRLGDGDIVVSEMVSTSPAAASVFVVTSLLCASVFVTAIVGKVVEACCRISDLFRALSMAFTVVEKGAK